MTDGQIDKLKPPLCCGIHESLVGRLLEERRWLLEAMDSIIGQVEDACINDCGICRFCVSEGVARKAIAFAEAESTTPPLSPPPPPESQE